MAESIGLIERAAQKPYLELIEQIERVPARLHRTAAALGLILDALQRHQGIDAADHPQRRRGIRRLRLWLIADGESAGRAALGRRGCRERSPVRSVNAHGADAPIALFAIPWVLGALVWLMTGKHPGNSCRPGKLRPASRRTRDEKTVAYQCAGVGTVLAL